MTSADLVVIGGGQSGLATAHVALRRSLRPLVLDASPGPGGSWPSYYDSLTLFSPASFSALPGRAFPGDPDRYPVRDEVVDYLAAYAAGLDAEVRFGARVERVTADGGAFTVAVADGSEVRAPAVVAATGGFGTPYLPTLPGLESFTGRVLHAAQYRNPDGFAGARVVVVGGGNSAVQIAVELAGVANVSLATRRPLRFQRQRILGRDFHWWLTRTGLDTSSWGPRLVAGAVPVIDDGRYRAAIRAGRPDHRPLFAQVDGDRVWWADGTVERVEVIVLATGYRPDLPYLAGTGALDGQGLPRHAGGVSAAVAGLGFVGVERQRSFASATLRGVGRDAGFVLDGLLARAGRHAAGSGR
ncbi:putative flavoprotein involved in K+ transport [Actinoplanes octamycinicus]|uniref:Putative flavoprotein involved in K+ transport n=1 Tax=Actinoplanes octamycinicus TaxID=135948 RepID=A0A7W7H4T7_9ACTN|nr:NAD(P)/FAD-dependent oxidoreductase [Actinoplanes octamycinicus]MBB4744013.1 putative flavoprotein involved in K+ transport [Actinoplanes octamycinicus]GIE58638.1 monooxygenase [Actinoplanes octamycinicus]